MDTPQLLSTRRVRKYGSSYVLTLDKLIRSAIGAKAGDDVAFRKVGRYVFISVVRACAVLPISKAELKQAREALGV